MLKFASAAKSAFLEEPFGTANNRLRRNLIFSLVVAAKRNECFRCGDTIESVETFSIDHIKDWLHVDKALFWDVSNLAFSHRKCNKQSRNPRKCHPEGPEGTTWCAKCNSFQPNELFGDATSNMSKRTKRYRCNPCRKSDGWH